MDLHRLRFVYNKAVGEGKNESYIAALKRFTEENAGHELASMARFQWASTLHAEGKFVEARTIALAGKQAFPDSPGGKLCHNLILGVACLVIPVLVLRLQQIASVTVS